jgi:hypothetical protein
MATATAEPDTQVVTFVSWCPNQVVTRRATRYIATATGQRVEQTQQDWIREQQEKNEERELNKLPPKEIDEAPWKVEFQNSRYDTSDMSPESAEIITDFLRSHWLFQHPHGFWEMGAAPDEPRPTLSEQNVRIARASVAFDTDELQAVINEEKATHNRPSVIQGAEAAIGEVEKLKAEIGSSASDDDDGATDESRPADDAT